MGAQSVPPPLPYASPVYRVGEPDAYADGPFLVMRKHADLPDRCVNCNRPAQGVTMRKRLLWGDFQESPSDLKNLIPFVRIARAFRSLFDSLWALTTVTRTVVTVPVCTAHRRSTRVRTIVIWLGIPTGVGASAFLFESQMARLWAPVAGVAISTFAARKPRPVSAAHIGVTHVTLRGVCPEFLAELPSSRPEGVPPASVQSIISSTAELKRRMAANRDARPADDQAAPHP